MSQRELKKGFSHCPKWGNAITSRVAIQKSKARGNAILVVDMHEQKRYFDLVRKEALEIPILIYIYMHVILLLLGSETNRPLRIVLTRPLFSLQLILLFLFPLGSRAPLLSARTTKIDKVNLTASRLSREGEAFSPISQSTNAAPNF